MTTDKQELPELLPCPFCGGRGTECNSAIEGQTVICGGCLARVADSGSFRIAREKWNTRPAKAVGGDKADLADAIHVFEVAISATEFPSVQKEKFILPMFEAKKILETLRDAHTPESEGIALDSAHIPRTMTEEEITAITAWYAEKHGVGGIAGKGDLSCHDVHEALQWLKRVPQQGSCPQTDLAIRDNIKVALSTLARPQEIDVEALFYATVNHLDGMQQKPCSVETVGAVRRAIDHLHSSGYLSAPDGREKELMAVIADLDMTVSAFKEIEGLSNTQKKHAAIIAQAQAQKGG